ncbi:hypothetical protein GCM10011348_07630 [Marinobacterium nitratireducens]|uniref:Uncharacterized protein n=1 Tax=Marinobacterium nitratireducens TaxID=518897 RepID=A0A917Z9E7_9GAMM|nr:NACHT domain-containing protein [Marinobacterium nitratireducens]GGO77632.1 hypothetical protein GCM10011348_07630 [Marinobacterium nitratireducens]
MSDKRFPILGTSVPPMLGRKAIVQGMVDALSKSVPDHLQVVGPRFAGKTVILHELAGQLRQASLPYSAVVLWDLGHQTPGTDEQFMLCFARELSSAIEDSYPDYAKHIRSTDGNPYHEIAEVLELLTEEGTKVLVIMDGFDKPLANGQLTRNLWDQLLELARKPSLRLVTASRQSLYKLLRSPESQTSDFWGIFDTRVPIGCFDEDDLAAILEELPDMQFSIGAKTELSNAGNGFPVITLGVLNALCETGTSGIVSPEDMKVACSSAFPSLNDAVDALWIDCSSSSQDLLMRVLEEKSVPRTGIPSADAETLIERGFVRYEANKLQRVSRILCTYLEEQPHDGNALVRLFGTADSYKKNLNGVLERRIGQLNNIDPTLQRFLERCTDDLPDHPDVFLTNIRGIVNQAFELIWKAELPDRRIPSGWMAIWKQNRERGVDDWETTFPQGIRRVRLLNLMTGTDKSVPCANHVSKETYILMNAVHVFGDFGQHQEGTPIDHGTAYAALHLCVELAATLARELPT